MPRENWTSQILMPSSQRNNAFRVTRQNREKTAIALKGKKTSSERPCDVVKGFEDIPGSSEINIRNPLPQITFYMVSRVASYEAPRDVLLDFPDTEKGRQRAAREKNGALFLIGERVS